MRCQDPQLHTCKLTNKRLVTVGPDTPDVDGLLVDWQYVDAHITSIPPTPAEHVLFEALLV
jgi:hypothetical protein